MVGETPASMAVTEAHATPAVAAMGTEGPGSPCAGRGYLRTSQMVVPNAPSDTTIQDLSDGDATTRVARLPTKEGTTASIANEASARITIANAMTIRIKTGNGAYAASSSEGTAGTDAIGGNRMGDRTRQKTAASNAMAVPPGPSSCSAHRQIGCRLAAMLPTPGPPGTGGLPSDRYHPDPYRPGRADFPCGHPSTSQASTLPTARRKGLTP